ncbi:membrane biogenesis protein Yop1 [Ascosphaera apis ARSEF 7405]|uniref:Protein YOP1 n=1 Tax=Ascosphaera apis ARSEF 7405 TaxID=392613 RepID=A0A166MZ34_9EURO|nr:membrane biogenesis protein Yop1 [Ascosphaera apis ARSEF 7405]
MSSIQDRAIHHMGQLDKELSKYPYLNNLERQTSVPKVYAFLGLVGLYVFLIFFNIGGHFLVNFAGFIIPGYYSLEALFSVDKRDDSQWLTYWVVFAMFTVLESLVNAAYWFPFYYIFKFVLILWMALPQFSGAQLVFNSFIRPVFARYFQTGSTSANLRSQADAAAADKPHSS